VEVTGARSGITREANTPLVAVGGECRTLIWPKAHSPRLRPWCCWALKD